jgi:hypothetical protein
MGNSVSIDETTDKKTHSSEKVVSTKKKHTTYILKTLYFKTRHHKGNQEIIQVFETKSVHE